MVVVWIYLAGMAATLVYCLTDMRVKFVRSGKPKERFLNETFGGGCGVKIYGVRFLLFNISLVMLLWPAAWLCGLYLLVEAGLDWLMFREPKRKDPNKDQLYAYWFGERSKGEQSDGE